MSDRQYDEKKEEKEEKREEKEEKSWEVTFAKDIGDWQILRKELLSLSEDVARRLWKRGLRGRTVKLKLRYADFTTLTR